MSADTTLSLASCPTCGRIIPRPLFPDPDGTIRCPRRRCRDRVPVDEVVSI